MTESNVRIINELKNFLETKAKDPIARKEYISSPQSFSRKRVLTFDKIVILIISGLKRTLSFEIFKFMESFLGGVSYTKQAFSEQRMKLKPCFLYDFNQVLVQSYYREYNHQVKTWKGFVVWAIDGSTIPLAQTKELKEYFGFASNQSDTPHNVTARVCLISDVLNGIVINGLLHSYFTSEEDGFLKLLGTKDMKGKLLVFDRGYSSYWFEYVLMRKDVKFIMRVKKNENKQICEFLSSEETDITQEWYPSYKSLKKLKFLGFEVDGKTPIKIRMVKILLNTGETEVLITNLYDGTIYSAKSLKEAYHFRWGIETVYGNLKEKYQLGQFSGIRQTCIEQDFAANIFLYNLHSLIEKQTEPHLKEVNSKRKHCYKINKNVSLGILKEHVINLFLADESRKILRELEKLFGNYLEPVRPNRKYPRIQKRRPHGKYYTLTNYKRAI